MKKQVLFVVLFLTIGVYTYAQKTISYGQISCYCPQTGQTLGGGGAIAITFYDGYISHPMYGKLYYTQRNNDGSITYVPKSYAGTPGLQLNAVLISADYQRMEERITSSFGYASLNMINSYTSMGEDGGRAAQRWAEANAASQRGSDNSGSGSSYSRNQTSSCSQCYGTGNCSICHGSGLMDLIYTGNQKQCTICRGTGRCTSCRGTGQR